MSDTSDESVVSETGVKLCKDCKHYTEEIEGQIGYAEYAVIHWCWRHGEVICPVTGIKIPQKVNCHVERDNCDGCFYKGRFWEAK